jgi:hypothetical protein
VVHNAGREPNPARTMPAPDNPRSCATGDESPAEPDSPLCFDCRERPDGTRGAALPPTMCRLCWYEHLVWRHGVWMLGHRGELSDCIHDCHDDTFLKSTS